MKIKRFVTIFEKELRKRCENKEHSDICLLEHSAHIIGHFNQALEHAKQKEKV